MDYQIKYCKEKSNCPVGSPSYEDGWFEIGEGCWKRVSIILDVREGE